MSGEERGDIVGEELAGVVVAMASRGDEKPRRDWRWGARDQE